MGYQDAEPARQIATAMYNDGVDVIFVAAGESGLGVIQAATELSGPDRQLWAIGVDTDQFFDIDEQQRAHLLTSMFKRIDRGVKAVVAAHVDGTLQVPGVINVTLADGGVGYTDTGGYLQATTTAALERFRTQIVDGTIIVDPVPAIESPIVTIPVFLYDLRTGEQVPLPTTLGGGGSMSAAPDGTTVARSTCCGPKDAITIGSIDGREVRTVSTPSGMQAHTPVWSPRRQQARLQAARRL